MEGSKFYTLLVIGDNPEELIKKYDINLEVEPYIKYYYKDSSKLKKKTLRMLQDILDNKDKATLSDVMLDYLSERIKILKGMSDFEYYSMITEGCVYNEDGDAMSTTNPDGQWKTCNIGKNLCIPLKLRSGEDSFQAKVSDIDWGQMHMANKDLYTVVWQLYHKERVPRNEQEKKIYKNIKTQKKFFAGFESLDEYLNYNCSYWCYAVLSENGWVDADDYKNYEWITTFYDRYIKSLNSDEMITIYEYSK